MYQNWFIKKIEKKDEFENFSESVNFLCTAIKKILFQRGINNKIDLNNYIYPKIEQINNPFLLKDMEKVINLIKNAKNNKENILLIGDYDVDGITSTAILSQFLKSQKIQIDYYIPDRHNEGYGISKQSIDYAIKNKIDLIISLDCGITAIEQVNYAKANGLKIIITDHHQPGEQLPNADAVINPKQKGDNYPFKDLSGCGVAFKIIHAFILYEKLNIKLLYDYLDMTMVSIACDIMPMLEENRIIAHFGLRKLNKRPCPGLKKIVELCKSNKKFDITDVVFLIGPKINAKGRLDKAHSIVQFFFSGQNDILEMISKEMIEKNDIRKGFDKSITEDAVKIIESDINNKDKKGIVVYDASWNKGVIGIVASRLVEKYYKPSVVLTNVTDEIITGSCRSVENFNLFECLNEIKDLFIKFGGHYHAAGLSMFKSNLEEFKVRFENNVSKTITEEALFPKLEIDLQIDFNDINEELLSQIELIGPFGPCNMYPVFMSDNIFLKSEPTILKEEHLKFYCYQNNEENKYFEAIAFKLGYMKDKIMEKRFKIVYLPYIKIWNGIKSIALEIKDIKVEE